MKVQWTFVKACNPSNPTFHNVGYIVKLVSVQKVRYLYHTINTVAHLRHA